MRRLALPLGLVLGLVVAGAASGASTSRFGGEWVGNDPAPPDGDGSVVHLSITGGMHPNLKFTDEFGTVCVNVGSPDTAFSSTLTGEVSKDLLVAFFRSARCGSVPLQFLRGQHMVLYYSTEGTDDPSDDTVYDAFGDVTFYRDN